MKLQCAPGCGANGDKDDFYEASTVHKTIDKSTELAVQYNLDDIPSHLVRKTMKYQEVRRQSNGAGVDEVDRAESSQSRHQVTLDFPTMERNIQSKVVTPAPRNAAPFKLDQGLV